MAEKRKMNRKQKKASLQAKCRMTCARTFARSVKHRKKTRARVAWACKDRTGYRLSHRDTPYGRIVLSRWRSRTWKIVGVHTSLRAHLLFIVITTRWANRLRSDRAHGKLRLIVCGDEFTPGNPNRVDGRSLMHGVHVRRFPYVVC